MGHTGRGIARGPEYVEVQHPAAMMLRDACGYLFIEGSELDSERSSESDVLLERRLAAKLREINEGLSDSGVKQAIDALKAPVAGSLIEANEKAHRLISRWATVEEFVKGQPSGRSVRYIDFDNPENNEFLVVEEFTVKGPRYPRRMDLVIFVNGIPVMVAECKRQDDPHGIEKAIGDLHAYQDPIMGVSRLFHTVQLCIALKGIDARYGTIETPANRFFRWKISSPIVRAELTERLGRKLQEQDILLGGMLSKTALLDFIRTFVAFDREGGRMVKKLARYQQFEAVNKAVARITDPESYQENRDRGGVIWHTQGSGKSLSMLWLCVKLRREKELRNPTLLIITDRRDLDRQIHDTFMNCGFENPTQATRINHLRSLLNSPSGQTIMSTVQKFRDDVDLYRGSRHPVLSKADNIFVLIDEAHRSEYGLFQAHLRRALPNACMLAFTGTPITKTTQKFGSYIHKYTMPQSVADGATVPILYESRLPDLAVWGGKRLEPIFEAAFDHLSEEQRAIIKKQEITERKIAETPDRIEMIALDIYQHYHSQFEPDGFKAQVAACSQRAAAIYYREMDKLMPGRVAVLISDPAKKDSNLWELKNVFNDEEAIIKQFKYESIDQLAIIIVVDKYLTGFDAPIERVLYLDKPLKEHNLLQAIARVNRPVPEKDKNWGLIVDYWGVSSFLDKALASFEADLTVNEVMNKRSDEQAYEELRKCQKDVFACFPPELTREDIEPWILALEPEDAQSRFLAVYRAFYKALERLLPDERALKFLGDFAWFKMIRREMLIQYSVEDLDLAGCSEKVRELINRHVKGEEVQVLLKPIPIMSESFSEEIQKLESPRAKASRMEHAISHTISVKTIEDPVFYESLRERLEKIIRDRKQQRITDVEEFNLLNGLRDDLKRGQGKSAEDLGVSQDVYAFYGLLESETEGMKVAEESTPYGKKDLAESVVEILKEEAVIDWINKEDIQREMRRKVKRQLRISGVAPEMLEELTTSILDLAKVRFGK